MARRRRDTPRLKILMAQESARSWLKKGVQDFRSAKRKAAIRLAVTDKAALPDNAEIEQALLDYQRLFHADRQALRPCGPAQTAVEIMRFLARFRPGWLVGAERRHRSARRYSSAPVCRYAHGCPAVLDGTPFPFDTTEHRLKLGNGDLVYLPPSGSKPTAAVST